MNHLTPLLTLLAAFPTLILTAPRPQTFECGFSPTTEDFDSVSQVLSNSFPDVLSARQFDPSPSELLPSNLSDVLGEVNIDTWIHIVAESKVLEDGWIPDEQVVAQMVELNANYAPQSIKFNLLGVTRTINALWANDAWGAEFQMKRALRRGDYKTLNIYFQKNLVFGAFGYAKFPGNFSEGSIGFIMDGINNRFDTVPGGSFENYNLGRTVTHETGHWLGLFHTFQGFDCLQATGGDLIPDTPAQSGPSFGCPIGRDSCPDQIGLDPIHNFMDYSDDPCYQEFTPDQTKRMHDIYHTYRSPRLCHADHCLRALRASTIPGRLEESQAFCGAFTKVLVTDVSVVEGYAVEACGGGDDGGGSMVSRVSSACSCLPVVATGIV